MPNIWTWVLHPRNQGFGDRWATINYVLQQDKLNYFSSLVPDARLACYIASLLKTNNKIKLIHAKPNRVPNYCDVFRNFLPTKRSWCNEKKQKIVTYQFDGRSFADRKNFTKPEEFFILKILAVIGYKTINVGCMMQLKLAIDIMAKSSFFVGICSGMSHVARSVTVPSYIVYNNMNEKREKSCTYRHHGILLHNYRELMNALSNERRRIREYKPHRWILERKIEGKWQKKQLFYF